MTVQRIKKEALAQFAEKGYAGTTLAAIAESVGIKKPSLYAHFAGKEDIFYSVYEDVIRNYITYLEKIMQRAEGLSVEKQLYTVFRGVIFYYLNNETEAAFLKRVLLYPPSSLRDKIVTFSLGVSEELLNRLNMLFEEGKASGVIGNEETHNMIVTYSMLVSGCIMKMVFTDALALEKQLEGIWRIFWTGIRK